MISMLLAVPLEDHDLSSLERVSSGGAPLAIDVARELERRVPSVEVREGYGCTESSALISAQPEERRLGSVGKPVAGVEVRIEAPDGSALPAGEDGEICVRGPVLMQGYWNAAEATAETLSGGWLHTGDVGHLDEDGYLYVVDRIKDLIIRNGFNVYPRDVEDALLAHPEITGAAVVGRPDPRTGEEVVAFVSVAPGSTLTPDQVVAYAKEHLSAAKYPREVRVVDAIPLTSVLKTDRKALRSQVRTPSADAGRPLRRRHPPPRGRRRPGPRARAVRGPGQGRGLRHLPVRRPPARRLAAGPPPADHARPRGGRHDRGGRRRGAGLARQATGW